jgi:hypothetical protein
VLKRSLRRALKRLLRRVLKAGMRKGKVRPLESCRWEEETGWWWDRLGGGSESMLFRAVDAGVRRW